MCTATMAEDYRKEVEVEDLVTRSRRVSTKLKSLNTLTRNQMVDSSLVDWMVIKMACGSGIAYLEQTIWQLLPI